jgi:hypothetical protein
MSRIASTLVNEGVPETVAEAIDHGFNPHTYTPAQYLLRISVAAREAAITFGASCSDCESAQVSA